MFKKLASVMIITAIVCTLGGTSAFASNTSDPSVKNDPAIVPSEAPAKKEVKPNEQLKNKMLQLVTDAKAGKGMPVAKSQIQQTKGNNWSKGTKIAVGAGVAAAVIVVILIVRANHTVGPVF